MAKDTAIVTIQGEKETVLMLSNGTTFNDLELYNFKRFKIEAYS